MIGQKIEGIEARSAPPAPVALDVDAVPHHLARAARVRRLARPPARRARRAGGRLRQGPRPDRPRHRARSTRSPRRSPPARATTPRTPPSSSRATRSAAPRWCASPSAQSGTVDTVAIPLALFQAEAFERPGAHPRAGSPTCSARAVHHPRRPQGAPRDHVRGAPRRGPRRWRRTASRSTASRASAR